MSERLAGGERTMSTADPYAPAFGRPVAPWHRWLAWRPVETVDYGWVWLRRVHRRRVHKHSYLDGPADFWLQYAVEVTQREQEPTEPEIEAAAKALCHAWALEGERDRAEPVGRLDEHWEACDPGDQEGYRDDARAALRAAAEARS